MNASMFLTSPPKMTAEQRARVETLRAEQQAARQRREESWARSDTDGFLSQWANGVTDQHIEAQIKVLENGGYHRFAVVVDADGNVVAERQQYFPKFNAPWLTEPKWRVRDEYVERVGRKWLPVGANSRVQKQLGLSEQTFWFPAVAKVAGKGTGLSGSVWIEINRVFS